MRVIHLKCTLKITFFAFPLEGKKKKISSNFWKVKKLLERILAQQSQHLKESKYACSILELLRAQTELYAENKEFYYGDGGKGQILYKEKRTMHSMASK